MVHIARVVIMSEVSSGDTHEVIIHNVHVLKNRFSILNVSILIDGAGLKYVKSDDLYVGQGFVVYGIALVSLEQSGIAATACQVV